MPQSFFDSAARNDVLQVVIYAVIFGIALARVQGRSRENCVKFFRGAVGGHVQVYLGRYGFSSFRGWSGDGLYNWTTWFRYSPQSGKTRFYIVYSAAALHWARPDSDYVAGADSDWTIFSDSQRTGTACFFHRLFRGGIAGRTKIDGAVWGSASDCSVRAPYWVLVHLDGSTLYLALASMFVAQAAGIELPISQQILMLLTLMLTSKGVAAVPRASLVILSGILAAFKLPLEGVALILGVDAFLDMARTSVNLLGNCLASAVIARWEGELQPEQGG